jgi:hypothetical protein
MLARQFVRGIGHEKAVIFPAAAIFYSAALLVVF